MKIIGQAVTKGFRLKSVAAVVAIFVMIGGVGAVGGKIAIKISGGKGASLTCKGGMSHLSHVFDENASIFPGDPAPEITIVNTIPVDFFLLESVKTGTHTSTHFDAPGHFVTGGRTVDQLRPEEFIYPAYVIDVRDRIGFEGPNFQLSVMDIRAYEQTNGRIKRGSLVIIHTGFDQLFGTPAFLGDAPGFSGDTVQWLFDKRHIKGLGSDTFGPDATMDIDFLATDTALRNDGVAIPGLANLDSLAIKGDMILAPAVRLRDGSGYQVNALGCHGSKNHRGKNGSKGSKGS